MAFTTPTFNLLCDIWEGPFLMKTLRLADVPCNLALGRRVQQLFVDPVQPLTAPACPNLLLPPLTDVRDQDCNTTVSDFVEVPKGTGRWYIVLLVDDVGKGFPNEYRLAAIAKISAHIDGAAYAGLFWPTPIP